MESNYKLCHRGFNLYIHMNRYMDYHMHPYPPFSFKLCPSTILPPQSVLTSRHTHPLPQYGDIHRSDMGKQHKHTFLEAHT